MVTMRAAAVVAVVAAFAVPSRAVPMASFEESLMGIRTAVFEAPDAAIPVQSRYPGVSIPKAWDQFEKPDAATAAWLQRRVPGLDIPRVRVVPLDVADAVMKQGAAAGVTYVDLLSDAFFLKPEIYFVPSETLAVLDRRYIAGSLQVSGTAEDGRSFQMLGLVVGQGKVHILYDRSFSYKDDGKRFKVEGGARVSATIAGRGDLALEGLSTWGAAIVCPWARMQRITKESAFRVKVVTNCGTRSGLEIKPVRNRPGLTFFRFLAH